MCSCSGTDELFNIYKWILDGHDVVILVHK